MAKGVDIVIGDTTIRDQSAVSGSYGGDSLASGVYQKIETYDNDISDVKRLEAFQVGSGKVGVIILHD